MEQRLESYAAGRGRRLPVDEVATIIGGVASALDTLHRVGWHHGDLKPSYVMYDPASGSTRLLPPMREGPEAGFVQSDSEQLSLRAGSLAYCPPEVLTGDEYHGPAADQYGLAAIAYALLVGRPPHGSETPRESWNRAMSQIPLLVHLPDTEPRLSQRLDAVLMRGLDRERSRRYPDVAAFATAFRDVAGDAL